MFDRKWWTAAAFGAAVVAVIPVLWRHGPSGEQLRMLDPAQVLVLRTPGGMLEVATLVRIEEFAWRSSYTCPVIDCAALLGSTVSSIRVPVHYVYRVPLAQSWELHLEGDQYLLTVPSPRPKLPPAMDTSKAEMHTNGTWFTPSKPETMEAMLRNVIPELNRRASQPENLAAQRSSAEKTVAEFARKWMKEQARTPARPVRVTFRDESGG